MWAILGTCCLLLLCCNFTGADVLSNLKKVSKVEALRSDSSDVIRALQREKRHIPEEVVKIRNKRSSFDITDNARRVVYTLTGNLRAPSDKWQKLVKSDQRPLFLTIVRNAFIGGIHGGDMEFHIDRSVSKYIHVTVRGNCKDPVITSPRGSSKRLTLERNYMRFDATLPRIGCFGTWTVSTNSSQICAVDVAGFAALGFTMSLMTKYNHESDSAYRAIQGDPNTYKSLAVILDGFGLEATKFGPRDVVETVRFVNESGHDVIEPVHVTDSTNGLNTKVRVYLNDGFKAPQAAYVTIKGKDFEGYRFTRVILSPIKPSHVTLTCEPRDVILQKGVETTFEVIIRNHGEADTFTVDVSDGSLFSIPKKDFTHLQKQETDRFPVSALASNKTATGTSSVLQFSVEGTQPGSSQKTSCNVVVEKPSNPRIDALTIEGTINSRFADTVVTSSMTNYADVGLEAKFDLLLPIDAFITNLTMTLDDIIIVGRVEEKVKAKKIYDKAKKRGKTTGHVASRESSTRVFKTSLFVGPGKNVIFRVTYQQLLGRSGGSYKYSVALNPNQVVKRLKVSVHIEEEEEIDYIHIPLFDNLSSAEARQPAGTIVTFGKRKRSAHIKYNPLPAQQTAFASKNSFSILYDVVRTNVFGDVTVANGYFAYFYTPVYLAPPLKKVVFIIDKSGSMGTTKMNQVKEAMTNILNSLDEKDYFSVIFFDGSPTTKGAKLLKATPTNVQAGLERVAAVVSGGNTVIVPAFKSGFDEFTRHFEELRILEISGDYDDENDEENDDEEDDAEEEKEEEHTNMIVFLTDGHGEHPEFVLREVNRFNAHNIAIHTIAFGEDAARDLLQSIAADHDGTYRMVFDGLTAAGQIEDFFSEIASPSLHNISITYPPDRVANVTETNFTSIGSKSEIVWAGKIRKDEELLDTGLDEPPLEGADVSGGGNRFINAHVSGLYRGEALDIDVPIDPKKTTSHIMTSGHQIENFTERLWAFLQIKQLLAEASHTKGNPTAKELLKEKALNMSLKYNFVTPLTSIVVVRPEDLKEIDEEIKKEEEEKKAKLKEEKWQRKEDKEKLLKAQQEEQLRRDSIRNNKYSSSLYDTRRGGRGGGYGDPHFVIPLRSDVNLCFNWDGGEGEVYNLLYDSLMGVTVNGQLVRTEAYENSGKTHRTYISVLGVVLPQLNLKILIRPHNVTLISEGLKNITLPVLSPLRITRHGVRLRMYDVRVKRARIELSNRDWSFDILVTRNIHNHHQACHVDFFVDRYKHRLGSPLSGIIGQFLDSDVKVSHDHQLNSTIMTINNRSGRVRKIERKQPWSREKVTCWSSHSNARDIIQGAHEHYLVENVLKSPSFF